MRKLLWIETKLLLRDLFVIYVCAGLIAWMAGVPHTLMLLTVAASCLTFRSRKSYWYLNLPISRQRLMKVLLIYSQLFWLAQIPVITALFCLIADEKTRADWVTVAIGSLGLGLFGTFFFTFRIFSGVPIRRVPVTAKFTTQHRLILLMVLIFAGVFVTYDIEREPIFYVAVLALAGFGMAVGSNTQFILPVDDLHRRTRKWQAVFGGGFAVTLAVFFAFATFAKPGSLINRTGLEFMGRLPAPISDARAVKTFSNSIAGDTGTMRLHIKALQGVTLADWTSRTAKCTSDVNCLNLSLMASDFKERHKSELNERAKVLMTSKGWKRFQADSKNCEKSETRSCQMVNALTTSGELERWLASDDVRAQVAAINALQPNFPASAIEKVKSLSLSDDSSVRAAAHSALAANEIYEMQKRQPASH